MKGARIQLFVDLLALLAVLSLTSTGLVLSWVLPPGSGRLAVAHGPVVLLWGLDREGWGLWHTRMAYLTLFTLAVHVALHHRWIAAMLRRIGGWKLVPFLVICALTFAPLFSGTEVVHPSPADPQQSQRLYDQHCLRCHGREARGIPLLPASDEQALRAILGARPQKLHDFLSSLTAEEQRQLLSHLRGLQSPGR